MNQAIYKKLKEVARAKDVITYGELNQELNLGLDFEKDKDRAEIGQLLDEINRYEHSQGHPMLTAVVIRSGENMPGTGFFELARQLGVYQGDSDLVFFVHELCKVHDCWSAH